MTRATPNVRGPSLRAEGARESKPVSSAIDLCSAGVEGAPGVAAVAAREAVYADSVERELPLYVAFNASFESKMVQLPQLPPGLKWSRVLDTAATAPFDFSNDELPVRINGSSSGNAWG